MNNIYFSQDNWWVWYYGDNINQKRQSSDLCLHTKYNQSPTVPIESFKTELENAARSTLDHYENFKPTILFSGGMDSELVIRSYLSLGVKPAIIIGRFENDYNIYDVSYAIALCSSMDLPYKLIDLNLHHFFETDAERISEQSQVDRPKILPTIKLTEYTDDVAIIAMGDLNWYRLESWDQSSTSAWENWDYEWEIGIDKYFAYHNKKGIGNWFKWTPNLIVSYTHMNWFKRLTNNQILGKLGVSSSKIEGFRENFPDLMYRKKVTGYEACDDLIQEYEQFLYKKYNNNFPYRQSISKSLTTIFQEMNYTE